MISLTKPDISFKIKGFIFCIIHKTAFHTASDTSGKNTGRRLDRAFGLVGTLQAYGKYTAYFIEVAIMV